MTTITVPALNDFLSAFFPSPNERICLRGFKPKKVDDAPNNKAVKIECSRSELLSDMSLRAHLKEINQTRGLYFVVNSGGHKAEEITRINAFFVESDTAAIPEQHIALDCGPLEPSIRVETKSSVHAYWLLEGECSIADWKDMQARLIQHFKSDSVIKDASRVMRLPYFNHLSLNDGPELHKQRVGLIVFEPSSRYTLGRMLDAFEPVRTVPKPEAKTARKVSRQVSDSSDYGSYPTWDALNSAAKGRILNLPSCRIIGPWAHARGVCHDGEGESGIFFNLATGAYGCFLCDTSTVLAALGLPCRPDGPPFNSNPAVRPASYDASPLPQPPCCVQDEPCESESSSLKPEGVIDVEDCDEQLNLLYQTGLQRGTDPGWPSVGQIYTVKRGQFTVITGIPGSGKSAFLDALIVNLAQNHNWKFAVASFENQPVEQYMATLFELYTGEPFTEGWTPRMSEQTRDEAKVWLREHFSFLLPKDGQRTIHGLLAQADWLYRNRRIDGFVLDPWNEIEHKRPPGMMETEYVSLALSMIRNFARERSIHVWLVAHPTKLYRDKSGNYPTPTLYDISGSSHFRNKADFGIVVSRDISDESNPSIVNVQKVRFRWCGRLGEAMLYFDRATGRYSETPNVRGAKASASQEGNEYGF